MLEKFLFGTCQQGFVFKSSHVYICVVDCNRERVSHCFCEARRMFSGNPSDEIFLNKIQTSLQMPLLVAVSNHYPREVLRVDFTPIIIPHAENQVVDKQEELHYTTWSLLPHITNHLTRLPITLCVQVSKPRRMEGCSDGFVRVVRISYGVGSFSFTCPHPLVRSFNDYCAAWRQDLQVTYRDNAPLTRKRSTHVAA